MSTADVDVGEQALDAAPGRAPSTALDLPGEQRTVRVTHPFHPWVGREFVFVAVRQTWGEDRVFFLDEDGTAAVAAEGVDGRWRGGSVRRGGGRALRVAGRGSARPGRS